MSILICSSTIILSLSLEVITKLKRIKSLAHKGYKFDNFKLFSCNKFLYFIPFINLVNVMKEIKKYNISKNIIPLNDIEKNILKNNSNIFDILNLNISDNLKANMMIVYMKDGIENIIYFTREKQKNIIISTEGPISNLSKDIQYEQLQEQLQDVLIEEKIYNSEVCNQNISETINKLKTMKSTLLNETNKIIEKEKIYIKNYFN